MKTYIETESGSFTFEGMNIPNLAGNRHYRQMQDEVTAGTATIILYVVSLDDVKTIRKIYINAERVKAIDAGLTYGDNTYDTDAQSRENLTGIHTGVNDGYTLPVGFTWRTSDNQDIPFTVVEVNGLAHAMLDHVNNAYGKSWALKASIDAATTEDAVNAIVW